MLIFLTTLQIYADFSFDTMLNIPIHYFIVYIIYFDKCLVGSHLFVFIYIYLFVLDRMVFSCQVHCNFFFRLSQTQIETDSSY